MLQTTENPLGLPLSAFDAIRAGVQADRSQFFRDLSEAFYGYNRPGATPSQGVRDSFWRQGMQAGMPASYLCIKQFSETDFTSDLVGQLTRRTQYQRLGLEQAGIYMLQQAKTERRRFTAAGFRLNAHVLACKDRWQRCRLNRGHGKVAQVVQVVDLGGW